MLDFLVDGIWYILLYGIALYIAMYIVANKIKPRIDRGIDKFFAVVDRAWEARQVREALEKENNNNKKGS